MYLKTLNNVPAGISAKEKADWLNKIDVAKCFVNVSYSGLYGDDYVASVPIEGNMRRLL